MSNRMNFIFTGLMGNIMNATGIPQEAWAVFVAKLGAMDDFLLFNLLTNAECVYTFTCTRYIPFYLLKLHRCSGCSFCVCVPMPLLTSKIPFRVCRYFINPDEERNAVNKAVHLINMVTYPAGMACGHVTPESIPLLSESDTIYPI
jgi:hypothetical protein